jgi:hypothetical protein
VRLDYRGNLSALNSTTRTHIFSGSCNRRYPQTGCWTDLEFGVAALQTSEPNTLFSHEIRVTRGCLLVANVIAVLAVMTTTWLVAATAQQSPAF